MKYVIWNKTKDQFWAEDEYQRGHWSNRYYATKYTLEELEIKCKSWFDGSGDIVFGVMAIFV